MQSAKRWWISGVAALVALYFLGFMAYYRITEGWTHPADWFFHLDAGTQATWLAAIAGVLVIWVTLGSTRKAVEAALAVPGLEAKHRSEEAQHRDSIRALAMTSRLAHSLASVDVGIGSVRKAIAKIPNVTSPDELRNILRDIEIDQPASVGAALAQPEILGTACVLAVAQAASAFDLYATHSHKSRDVVLDTSEPMLEAWLRGDNLSFTPANAINPIGETLDDLQKHLRLALGAVLDRRNEASRALGQKVYLVPDIYRASSTGIGTP